MSRTALLDSKYQQFVTQQYEKEALARIKFYQDTKAGKGHATKSYVIGLPKINPGQYALKKKAEEDMQIQRLVEEARAKQVKEEMWPIDPVTRQRLYAGISHDGHGRYRYLSDRLELTPENKFTFPVLSSWQYGWKISDEVGAYQKPKYGRTAKGIESFYSRNGVATLKDPTTWGGVCMSD